MEKVIYQSTKKINGVKYYILIFSSIWTLLVLIGLSLTSLEILKQIWYVFLIMLSFGGFFVFMALKQMNNIHISVTKSKVHYQKKGWLEKKEWQENIPQYQGILYHLIQKSRGNSNHSTTYHTLSLKHQNAEKSVKLHSSTLKKEIRSLQEQYCKDLNLPALFETEKGIEIRKVEHLDAPIAELLKEGIVQSSGTHKEKFPEENIQMIDQFPNLIFLSKPSTYKWKWLGLGLIIGGLLTLFSALNAIIPGLVMLTMGSIIFFTNNFQYHLFIGNGFIRLKTTLFGKEIKNKSIPYNNIEEILTYKYNRRNTVHGLTFQGDLKSIVFPHCGNKKEEKWIVDYIYNKIQTNNV